MYYREAVGGDRFRVLDGDKVTVKDTVTKAQLDEVRETNKPTLTFTAYAVQKDGIADAVTAWAKVTP